MSQEAKSQDREALRLHLQTLTDETAGQAGIASPVVEIAEKPIGCFYVKHDHKKNQTRLGACPKWASELNPGQLRGVIAHEIGHCILGHPQRDSRRSWIAATVIYWGFLASLVGVLLGLMPWFSPLLILGSIVFCRYIQRFQICSREYGAEFMAGKLLDDLLPYLALSSAGREPARLLERLGLAIGASRCRVAILCGALERQALTSDGSDKHLPSRAMLEHLLIES